tara:strand:+ start:2419 stop:2916 length:498 start_codon:yes stop_codon:yes gene_type:complete
MNDLKVINAINASATSNGTVPKRRCSLNIIRTDGGDVVSVILHSARYRDTKCVSYREDEFQREFFLETIELFGVCLEDLLDHKDGTYTVHDDLLDEIVESYWSGDRPEARTDFTLGEDEHGSYIATLSGKRVAEITLFDYSNRVQVTAALAALTEHVLKSADLKD